METRDSIPFEVFKHPLPALAGMTEKESQSVLLRCIEDLGRALEVLANTMQSTEMQMRKEIATVRQAVESRPVSCHGLVTSLRGPSPNGDGSGSGQWSEGGSKPGSVACLAENLIAKFDAMITNEQSFVTTSLAECRREAVRESIRECRVVVDDLAKNLAARIIRIEGWCKEFTRPTNSPRIVAASNVAIPRIRMARQTSPFMSPHTSLSQASSPINTQRGMRPGTPLECIRLGTPREFIRPDIKGGGNTKDLGGMPGGVHEESRPPSPRRHYREVISIDEHTADANNLKSAITVPLERPEQENKQL